MSDYITGIDRNQTILLPETVEDYVEADNPVRFLDAYVASLDLVELGFKNALPNRTGRPPYQPGDLIKLYIYGYLNKLRSSRQLEFATYKNLDLIWLIRKLNPDFKTIADFRKNNVKGLRAVCREFILLCKRLDLFGAELVAIDGSKFKAVNSKRHNYSKAKLKRILTKIDKNIAAYLKDLEKQDEIESSVKKQNAEEIKEQIKNLESRKDEVKQLQKQLEESGEKQISLTDSDSRKMRAGNGSKDICYNVQIVTDSKHKLIVEHEVTNAVNDYEQLSNMALKAQDTLGTDDLDVTADMGYYSNTEVKECQDNNINCHISKPEKSNNKKLGLYTCEDFEYNAEKNCYICPAKQLLVYRSTVKKGGKMQKVYHTKACKSCLDKAKCTRSKKERLLYRWVDQEIMEQMQQRVLNAPEKIKCRKALVEHPFGTIKHSMNQGYFLMKGLQKVSVEMSLSVLAYNIKRAINIIGVKELVKIVT